MAKRLPPAKSPSASRKWPRLTFDISIIFFRLRKAPSTARKTSADDFDPASEAGRERLHILLEQQHYRLMWWRSANDEINWRRFFDINELAAIRVEDDEVFEAVHATIFQLYAEA